jgi:tetratricopeptide (TPR) repeat protein
MFLRLPLLPKASMPINRDEELARAIRQKDLATVVELIFDKNPPSVRTGFKTEGVLWDFKREAPGPGSNQADRWAALAKDVVAFHNRMGGVIVFGVDDALRITPLTTHLDSKLVNDRLRKYVGDVLWCEFHREFIRNDQSYVGVLLIPPRGPRLLRFDSDSYDAKGRKLFSVRDSAIREGDSSILLRGHDVDAYARKLVLPSIARVFEVDDPFFRILAPDYAHFVDRPEVTNKIEQALIDPRISTVSLLGIGGAGKTALATWAVLRAHDQKQFGLIVSTTAKDRELTPSGIVGLPPALSSFEGLLDAVLEVLGFPDAKALATDAKEIEVRSLLTNTNGLLYVDNLETIDDGRTIRFLDELPVGVRAITTSRRTRVRVAVRPIEVGAFTLPEVLAFVKSLAKIPGYAYLADLKQTEIERIGDACDRIPLAVRWALARANSAAEALFVADGITRSGRRGEELLEFSFRRVFDGLSQEERRILETLALFQSPLTTEALLVGAGTAGGLVADPHLLDAMEDLVDDALLYRIFDARLNDYAYALLPITRAFVYGEVSRNSKRADEIRARLKHYFEAGDIKDANARVVIRESRQGNTDAESSLLDLAIGAKTRGDESTALQLFEQALARNPRSWRVAREFAEFQRHIRHNTSEALRLYEQAAANAPSRGSDRARIFREWGMLLKDSGSPDATQRAVECFDEALAESPNDELAAHALAMMLTRQGKWRRIIDICEPLLTSRRPGTREMGAKSLLMAYERAGETLKAAELKAKLSELEI